MTALVLGRTRLSVHPLALLFPILAARLGEAADMVALAAGLVAHEGAHLAAARCLGVGVSALRLMPFGAAIEMENPYALSPGRLFAVAAAGPAASGLMTLLTVVTTIFTPLTLLTGWYGMNFKYMPELEYKWSYPVVIAVSGAIAAACLIYFKKKKWM